MNEQDEGQEPSVNDQPSRSLEERVSGLEHSVEKLESTVRDLISALARRGRVSPPPAAKIPPARERQQTARQPTTGVSPGRPSSAPASAFRGANRLQSDALAGLKKKSAGFWLSRLGIGLLLLGVAFLFKYAVDEGWLTPTIRVAFGVGLGLALAVTGLRVEAKQRWFTSVMLGGASATFYITGFAAFQLFDLVGFAVAFGFMALITVYTFWAALHSDAPVLAIIGAIGGLGTPFLLYTESGTVAGLMMYTCIVLGGTSAIYLSRGWLSLLWTTVMGGWAVLLVGLASVLNDPDSITRTDLWALQLAAFVALLVFWAVPVAREALAISHPAQWQTPSRLGFARMMGIPEDRVPARSAQMLALSIPIATFFFARRTWPYEDWLAAGVAAALAVLLLIVWWRLGEGKIDVPVRSIHAVAASVLVAIGLQYAFQNHTLLVTWAAEVLILHFAARRLNERPLAFTAHVLFLVVVVWLGVRFVERPDAVAIFNAAALANALAIVAVIAASFQLLSKTGKRWYRLAAIFAFAGLCWSELGALPDGAGHILVAWTAIGVLLLFLSSRTGDRSYRLAGHLLFALTGYWLATRLTVEDPRGIAVANLRSALHLGVLAGAAVGSSLLKDREKVVYLLLAHVLFLTWLWQELSGLSGGHGFVSITWGVYALLLLLVGLRRDVSPLRKVGLATFLAVVVKLFLVDLSQLEPIWRILLFLGFGGLFLVLSYYFSSLWRERSSQPNGGGTNSPPPTPSPPATSP